MIEVSLTISPLQDARGTRTGASTIARDLTRLKQLEREVIDISANERRRIGHELHDGLGQYLAGIAFRAKALEQALAASTAPHVDAGRELGTLLGQAIGQVRTLARGFSPIDVERSGLAAALQNLAADTTRLFGTPCQVHCADSDLLIPPQVGWELYRIVQEAIHNAINHGHAQRIDLELALDTAHLRLRIRDDGVGFQAGRKTRPGIGVRVMEYRAHSIGGTLQINSQPGPGTEVHCRVPRVGTHWGDAESA